MRAVIEKEIALIMHETSLLMHKYHGDLYKRPYQTARAKIIGGLLRLFCFSATVRSVSQLATIGYRKAVCVRD